MSQQSWTRNAIRCLTMLAVAGAWLSATAQEPQELTVPLSRPGEPVELQVSLLSGGVEVEGYAGQDVRIVVIPEEMSGAEEPRTEGGMRRIPNTSLGLAVEEEGNVVEVRGNWQSRVGLVRIQVPRKASLGVRCTNNGDIHVRGVEGEVELRNTNGEIEALEISGTVLAHTTNGDVKVSFARLDRDTPMSFVTLNGDVDVTFPGDFRADLRVNAGQGEIFTDFDFELRPTEPQVENSREGGRYRVTLEREVLARVGGGGPEMHFKTWNGDIFIRRGM